jgi:hypothetical protein
VARWQKGKEARKQVTMSLFSIPDSHGKLSVIKETHSLLCFNGAPNSDQFTHCGNSSYGFKPLFHDTPNIIFGQSYVENRNLTHETIEILSPVIQKIRANADICKSVERV